MLAEYPSAGDLTAQRTERGERRWGEEKRETDGKKENRKKRRMRVNRQFLWLGSRKWGAGELWFIIIMGSHYDFIYYFCRRGGGDLWYDGGTGQKRMG